MNKNYLLGLICPRVSLKTDYLHSGHMHLRYPPKTRLDGEQLSVKLHLTGKVRLTLRLYKNNRIAFQEYNNYKNNLCKVIRKSKRDYFINKFNSCKNDIKGSWKIINSILSKKLKKSDIITILDSRGREIHDSNVIANDFCNYFSTIANRLDSDIPVMNTDPMGYMPEPIPASFTPALATEHEVETIIKSAPNKPVNINIMPIFIYKKIAALISPVIYDIFNSSVNEGMVPSNLKLSRTRPKAKTLK